ncbi:MAG: flagellar basal body rod protein FlgB [Pseudomonadota bacterium]
MVFSLDSILGIHGHALEFRARRSELLAQNLANAETPNYKARDVDFRQALEKSQASAGPRQTHERHLAAPEQGTLEGEAMYRVPLHPSLDGNTVTEELEKAAFTGNAVRYQATLMFLTRKFSALKGAMSDQ